VPVVRLQGVSYRYPKASDPAVDDVGLTLSDGPTALVGLNGAGKSTLMSIMSGGTRPAHGIVTVDGEDVHGRGRRRALRRIALMPQSINLPGHLTALESLQLLGWLRGLSADRIGPAARTSLEAVDLAERGATKVGQLSGGMVRRLALAQALVADPDVLLLDEPSTGLDPQQRRIMVDLVRGLSGVVLFSSHVIEDVVDVARDIIVLHEGRVLHHGALDSLLDRYGDPQLSSKPKSAEMAFLRLITDSDR